MTAISPPFKVESFQNLDKEFRHWMFLPTVHLLPLVLLRELVTVTSSIANELAVACSLESPLQRTNTRITRLILIH